METKRAFRATGFSPVIAYAARRAFLRYRERSLVEHTPAIQAAFREQRDGFMPYLSRVLDLRATPNPTTRVALIRALLSPVPLIRALNPLMVQGARQGAAFAATLLPARSKSCGPWWAAWDVKAATFDPGLGDMELPPEVVDQFPRLGERISREWQGINDTTVQAITAQVEEGMRRGYTPLQIAQGFPREKFAGIDHQFDNAIDWRSEMIARTESANAYNWGSWQRYADGGVTKLQAVDGDEDNDCRERNGSIYDMDPQGDEPIDNGYGTIDHPNGSLCWFPIVESIRPTFGD